MSVQSVGWLEAWGLWWQGIDVKPMALYGFPMIWVGRIAKVLTYAAGLVVVLDIVGPARVMKIAREMSKPTAKTPEDAFTFPSLFRWAWRLLLGLLFVYQALIDLESPSPSFFGWVRVVIGVVFGLPFALFGLLGMIITVITLVAKGLESESKQRSIRWAGFIVIAIGFTLDLLTS